MTTYSMKVDKNRKVAENFTVGEFASPDSDQVILDDRLPQLLQVVRNHFGKPINITSGFRTTKHNREVGGASNSQHLYGKAADFWIQGVTPMEIVQYLEKIGAHGVGLYGNFVHVDVRDNKSYWDQRSGSYRSVATFGATPYVKDIQKATGLGDATIKYLQDYKYGYDLIEKLWKAIKR